MAFGTRFYRMAAAQILNKYDRYLVIAFLFCPLFLSASHVVFTVIRVEGRQVIVLASEPCVPGTLFNMEQRDSSGRFITLKIVARRKDGSLVAVPSSEDVGLAQIKPGDKGETSSPEVFYTPLKIVVSSSDVSASRQLEDLLHKASIQVVESAAADSSTANVELLRSHGRWSVKISSVLGAETGELDNLDVVRDAIVDDSRSFYWTSLHNPSIDNGGDSSPRMFFANGADFEGYTLPVGKPIALRFSSSLGGFFSLLMVRAGGEVIVLYPNDLPMVNVGFRLIPWLPYDFTEVSRLDLTASEDPTIFVLLVSASPRPLSAFVPTVFRGTFLMFDQKRTVDPSTIGPGLLGKTVDADMQSIEESPSTWTAYNVVLRVAKQK